MSQLVLLRHLSLSKKSYITPVWLQHHKHFGRCRPLQQQRQSDDNHRKKTAVQQSSSSWRSDVSTEVRPLGEKIKENTKTASYTAIILAGIGVTGIMFYAIFRELFSTFSPNNVYSEALDRVKDDPRVQDSIGAPIKGFGEESRRGRRQHVAHQMYDRNGVPHMRMQFYVQGIRNKATVHLEARKTSSGNLEYRYLFLQLDHYPRTTIILEDNRAFDTLVEQDSSSSLNIDFSSFKQK